MRTEICIISLFPDCPDIHPLGGDATAGPAAPYDLHVNFTDVTVGSANMMVQWKAGHGTSSAIGTFISPCQCHDLRILQY